MNRFVTNKKQLLQLNTVALLVYILFCVFYGFNLSEEIMFSSTDSKGYLEVSNWIFNGEATQYTEKRPLLYPLLIGIPYQVFGVFGIWGLQVLCWLGTINFVFFGVKKWSNSIVLAWFSSVFIMLNLSLIILTFQGITEIVTTALLAYFFYFIGSNRKERKSLYFIHGILLILIALTLVKPLFYYPTLIVLVLLPIFYLKQYRKRPRVILKLVLILLPLLLQMTLVKVRHDTFKVSAIGSETFTNYYFSKCVRDIDGLDNIESVAHSNGLNTDEKIDYMIEHKGVFAFQFFENLSLNIKGDPLYFRPKEGVTSLPYSFMIHYNNVTFPLHLLGVLLMLTTIFLSLRKKEYDNLVPVLFIGGLSSYFIITSGLSFWQGDRLVLPSIALWVPLYAVLILFTVKRFKKKRPPAKPVDE